MKMEKIRLGRTGLMASRIGFGSIPIQRVSEDEAIAVVRRCLEHDINFLDTANVYSTSEERIGKAIAGRRDGLILATKTTSRNSEEVKAHLNLSLERLRVEAIDLYQLHDVSDPAAVEAIFAPNGPLAIVEEAKKAGVVKHIGISTHQIDIAKKLVTSDRFETIMFPLNFVTSEEGIEILSLARKHDVGFIVMKPLAGGRLENASLAFKYLLQFPDVVIIPGIEKPQEIDEIIQVYKGPQQLTEAEQKEMQRIREELGSIFCHRCDYCQPCTEGIAISTALQMLSFRKSMPRWKFFTGFLVDVMAKALDCSKCGECEERCPYNLPVMAMIEEYGNLYLREKREYEEELSANK